MVSREIIYEEREGREYVSQYSLTTNNPVREWLVEQLVVAPKKIVHGFGRTAGQILDELERGQMLRETYERLETRGRNKSRENRLDRLVFQERVSNSPCEVD